MTISSARLFAFVVCLAILFPITVTSQSKSTSILIDSAKTKFEDSLSSTSRPSNKAGMKAYSKIITDKAVTTHGMFKVHKIEEKWYFEIPAHLFNRDILTVARISKSAVGVRAGYSGYAGDEISENLVQFEKGPNNKLFIKGISYQETGRDSLSGMYWNVINSNMQPIISSFDIKAISPDSGSVVIDVTEFINGDNDILFFDGSTKRTLGLTGMQADKSYVTSVKAYPGNIEMKTVKTYGRSSSQRGGSPDNRPQNATFELNSSIVLLPQKPMQPRYFDDRVGYITTDYITDYDLNPQGVERIRFIRKFRLEPRQQDMQAYMNGKLVEPKNPIIYYIDPTTPKKWIPYLIQGINDWQVAFEKAGFMNAILGKIAPTAEEDPTWSIDDARHNAIIYKPSDVANASGPSIIDPRSGEIIETHINWYHNLMTLLRNWYFVQTAAIDSNARKPLLNDTLMGQLVRFACSHEVGHTLGLMHNFGASATVPVEKLRDRNWVETYGHTPSIMDYARFNYVAQPEDSISGRGLLPRIGDYDKWAIEWGYRLLPQFSNADEEKTYLNKWTIAKLKENKRLFWGDGEGYRDDPRNQTEDLGDNAMLASTYGIKNLTRIISHLPDWTIQSDQDYTELGQMYSQIATQFSRYCTHVSNNIGGIERTPKRVEQPGVVYAYTSSATQEEAMKWLQHNLFTTPSWFINKKIIQLTNQNPQSTISNIQERVLNNLLNSATISKLLRFEMDEPAHAYTVSGMISDLRKGIFSELVTKKPVDIFRRTLQKSLAEKLIAMTETQSSPGIVFTIGGSSGSFSPGLSKTSEAISIAKAELRTLQHQIEVALPVYKDVATKNHLVDVNDRIRKALEPCTL